MARVHIAEYVRCFVWRTRRSYFFLYIHKETADIPANFIRIIAMIIMRSGILMASSCNGGPCSRCYYANHCSWRSLHQWPIYVQFGRNSYNIRFISSLTPLLSLTHSHLPPISLFHSVRAIIIRANPNCLFPLTIGSSANGLIIYTTTPRNGRRDTS